MTQEEKELSLKDLCARLPYGVILYDEYCKKDYKLKSLDTNCFINYDIANSITHIKPYLRPMSSMTENEEKEYRALRVKQRITDDDSLVPDFLNSHHFDYRGLIEKDLALEATEGMYKTE